MNYKETIRFVLATGDKHHGVWEYRMLVSCQGILFLIKK